MRYSSADMSLSSLGCFFTGFAGACPAPPRSNRSGSIRRGVRSAGDFDDKRRTLARLAYDLYLSAEQVGEFLDDVKTQPHAAVEPGLGAVQLVKFLEDEVEIVRGHPRPVSLTANAIDFPAPPSAATRAEI